MSIISACYLTNEEQYRTQLNDKAGKLIFNNNNVLEKP
jgi:hypothetical protein